MANNWHAPKRAEASLVSLTVPHVGSVDLCDREQPNVSVFIMTLNEAANIDRCLESVRWSNDVVVLDSFSQDGTPELAAAYHNVRLFQRPFDDYSGQRNCGVRQIPYRNAWLLVLDADEVVESSLAQELLGLVRSGQDLDKDVFLLRRKVFIGDRWIRGNIANDFWIARVVRPTRVRYEGAVHERVRFDGRCGCLKHALEHHQFTNGVENWKARRYRYAIIEAAALASGVTGSVVLDLFCADTLRRRVAIKSVFYMLPARWLFYFFYNFLFKFPYRDGAVGLGYLFLETASQRVAARVRRAAKNARTR